MDNPNMNNANATQKTPRRPIAIMSWVILLIGLAAIVFAVYSAQNKPEEAPIETITREGVVTQIQQLNRLHTVAFSVDTVITSERPGSWMKLWQDEQKALFIAHGRVEAGVDLMMQVDPKILAQAQTMAKKEVLERACRGDVMNMALQNAQTQLQQLFALTGAVVTVTTQGAGACQLPVTNNS